jgi:hypothetical protein
MGIVIELKQDWLWLLQLVKKLSGGRASEEEKRRLAREIAAENDILIDFPENPVQIHQQVRAPTVNGHPRSSRLTFCSQFVYGRMNRGSWCRCVTQHAAVQAKQTAPTKNDPVKEFVEQNEVKADRHKVLAVILLEDHHSHLQNFVLTVPMSNRYRGGRYSSKTPRDAG